MRTLLLTSAVLLGAGALVWLGLAVQGKRHESHAIRIEGVDTLPPEVMAAMQDALRRNNAGEPAEGKVIQLDGAAAAALLKHVQGQQANAPARRGRVFPQPTLQTVNQGEVSIPGKPTLVNFWATWCAPCIAEMPLFEALDAEGEYRVITINNDFERGDLDDWLAANPLALPVHFDAGNALAGEFAVTSWPTTLVLDEQGVVVHDFAGAPKELEILKAMIRAY